MLLSCLHLAPQGGVDQGMAIRTASAEIPALGNVGMIWLGANAPTLPQDIFLEAVRPLQQDENRFVHGPCTSFSPDARSSAE